MSRRLPACAKCGEPLAKTRKGRILFEFTGNLGNPAIGWHTSGSPGAVSCSGEDSGLVGRAVEDFKQGERNGVPECIIEVWRRDPERVSLIGESPSAFEGLIKRQEEAKTANAEDFPSPCCGKPSAWEPGDFRRCPCGHRWRP